MIVLVASSFVLLAGYAYVWFAYLFLNRWPADEPMVHSGYVMIPEAKQIDEVLGPAWHRVVNYTEPDLVEWQTEALFGGRYEMVMIVDLRIDRRSGKVTGVLGEPRFLLREVQEIRGREVHYGGAGQREFTADEWQQVVKANGDFAAIGIQLNRNSPVPGFDRHMQACISGCHRQLARADDLNDHELVLAQVFPQNGLVQPPFVVFPSPILCA